MREQRRGRRIAMSDEERDAFLQNERTCRVATVGGDGRPHATALWFVWDGAALWLNSIVKSQRWKDLTSDGRVSVIVDTGDDFADLRGVVIEGVAGPVGEAPRTGEPVDELGPIETAFARKYMGTDDFVHDGRHAWLRIEPEKVLSWDYRKMGIG
jgi:hypothetical protein